MTTKYTADKSRQNKAEDNLTKLQYAGHIWEFGHFGEKNNSFGAYGFRQDGTIIRVTSQYEAELFANLMAGMSRSIISGRQLERRRENGKIFQA